MLQHSLHQRLMRAVSTPQEGEGGAARDTSPHSLLASVLADRSVTVPGPAPVLLITPNPKLYVIYVPLLTSRSPPWPFPTLGHNGSIPASGPIAQDAVFWDSYTSTSHPSGPAQSCLRQTHLRQLPTLLPSISIPLPSMFLQSTYQPLKLPCSFVNLFLRVSQNQPV